MMRRLLPSLAMLLALGHADRSILAQAQAGTPSSTFRVLKSVGTPDEQALLQRLTDRMRTKSADATFMKGLDAAVARKDFAGAHKLIADAAGVNATQVVLGLPQKVGQSSATRTPFAFASNRVPLNPFMLIIRIGSYGGCLGFKDECDAAMKQLGYEPA